MSRSSLSEVEAVVVVELQTLMNVRCDYIDDNKIKVLRSL